MGDSSYGPPDARGTGRRRRIRDRDRDRHDARSRDRHDARSRDREREERRSERSERRREREERRRSRRAMTPEERAIAEARKAAARKMGFLAHLVPYCAVCFFLLFVAGFRAAMIVALAWGIGLACHYFFAIVAPGLRERLVAGEVSRRVHRGVDQERRLLADEHAQRLEQLSASIAHEIRNPITAAKSLVQQMGEDPASVENVEYAEVALEELQRVEKSISHLLRFAREEEMDVRAVPVDGVVASALEAVAERAERLGVRITRDVDGAGSVQGDPDQLRRVLLNLVGNALDALEQAGTRDPRVDVQAGANLAGTEVWLRVRDNGPGIEPERRERIFAPFYTGKETGTGLGLAISKKLVDAHGGSIEVDSDPSRGTSFLVTLPRGGRDGSLADADAESAS